ncbi:hypothetical protein [Parapedobacter lycopersici]|uniref:hypothetical protein n=1 Tax=Parapedobacter lycopersici TaxID=1864939 RepID=UPI00214DECAE|nr:hypothetical protein [Parapedobacter lycopersici]
MKTILLSLAFITLFTACQQKRQQDQEETAVDPNAITCENIGPVKLSYTYADLETQIGRKNLEHDTLTVDGKSVQVTRVFPNDTKEIKVYWAESQPPYATITKLVISNSFGPYQTAEGLHVGSTLEDLRKLNNFMPVSMTNFYNSLDGFATITGFNGGDLELNYPCLGGRLDIVKQRGVDVRMLDEIQNNETLLSSHKLFNSLDVAVVELSIQ